MDSSREADLLKRLEESQEQNARLVQEIALLRQKIDLLVKRIFGASSEKLDAAQLELLLSPGTEEPGKAPASSEEEAGTREVGGWASTALLGSPTRQPL